MLYRGDHDMDFCVYLAINIWNKLPGENNLK